MPSKPQQVESSSSDETTVKSPKKKRKIRKQRKRLNNLRQKIRKGFAEVPKFVQHITHPRPLRRSYLFWFGVGFGFTSGAIVVGSVWYTLEKSLPDSVDGLLSYAREGTMTIEAADGTVIQEIGDVTHEYRKIWEIPAPLMQAFVASEDSRFYEHQGIDLQGILRAAVANFKAGEIKEGGSTITQQLTRISFLNQERKFWRKLREVRLASKIENNFPKDLILERYLNLVYLGAESYGVADAAWVYFSKPLEELTLPEAAMIAGLTPAPSLYSPFTNPKAAKTRRNLVLQRMEEEGYISPAQAQTAMAAPLSTRHSRPRRFKRIAPYFTDYVQKELPKHIDPQLIKAGGLTVETTLNPRWQEAAEAALTKTLDTYGRYQRFKQGSLVAVDPRSGQIKAMVGGRDYYNSEKKGYFNRATQAQRQPGSTFKTFVYSTAIAAGFSPYRGFRDAEYIVDGYKPENFNDKYRNGWVSMRDALVSSINVVAVRTLITVGWEPTIEIAKKMGIHSKVNPTYSLALGAYEVNLLELTNAYSTLANQGIHEPAYGISRVLDPAGKVIYEADFEPHQALDEETSAIMTWMLQGVVNHGTGAPAQIGRPVAGKTGTSDEARDLWFVGYIPQLVAGVWLGNDDFKPTWGTSGIAAATWRRFMREVVEDMPIEQFPSRPSKVEGRKGIIKAKPLKPKKSKYIFKKKSSSSSSSSRSSRSSSRRRSSRSSSSRSRRSSRSYQPRRSSSSSSRRRSTAAQKPAPRRSAPAPRRQAPPPPPPAAAPAPAPPSASVIKKPSKPKAASPAPK